MELRSRPLFTNEHIAAMDEFEAFRRAEELLDDRFAAEAATILKDLVARGMTSASIYELLGRAHFAAAHLRPAEDAFRQLIDLEPTSAWAHIALSRTLKRQSRHDESDAEMRIAQALGATGGQDTSVSLTDQPLD